LSYLPPENFVYTAPVSAEKIRKDIHIIISIKSKGVELSLFFIALSLLIKFLVDYIAPFPY